MKNLYKFHDFLRNRRTFSFQTCDRCLVHSCHRFDILGHDQGLTTLNHENKRYKEKHKEIKIGRGCEVDTEQASFLLFHEVCKFPQGK